MEDLIGQSELPLTLTCSRCKEKKLIDDFYNNASKANKKDNYCKICRKVHEAKYLEAIYSDPVKHAKRKAIYALYHQKKKAARENQ
jgi:hypothetical protein